MSKTLVILLIFVAVYILLIIFVRKPRPQKTKLAFFIFINNQFKQVHFMKLNVKEFLDAKLGLIDADTKDPIEAQFSEIKITSENETIASISDVNADGELDIVGLTAGETNILVEAVVTYTDKNTNLPVIAGKSKSVAINVAPVDPTAENVEFVVSFTDAQAVPDAPPVDDASENTGNLDAGTGKPDPLAENKVQE